MNVMLNLKGSKIKVDVGDFIEATPFAVAFGFTPEKRYKIQASSLTDFFLENDKGDKLWIPHHYFTAPIDLVK